MIRPVLVVEDDRKIARVVATVRGELVDRVIIDERTGRIRSVN